MSAMTNLLVKDDAGTPKEWTFVPVTDTPVPYWRTKESALPMEAQPRLWINTEDLKSGDFKVSAKLEIPVLETLGASGTALGYVAPPKVAYVTTYYLTMIASKRSTAQNRADGIKMIAGIITGASSTTATGTLDNTSAGGLFLAEVTPGLNAFVNIVRPN